MVSLLFLVALPLKAGQLIFYYNTQANLDIGAEGGIVSRDTLNPINKTVTIASGTPNGDYRMNYRVNFGTARVVNAVMDITVLNGAITAQSSFAVPAPYDPYNDYRYNLMRSGSVISVEFVNAYDKAAPAVLIPGSATAETWTIAKQLGVSGAGVVKSWAVAFHFGAPPCAPQPGPIAFHVYGSLRSEGVVALQLYVDGVLKGSKNIKGNTAIDGLPFSHAVSLSGLPGEFGYEWKLGGQSIASGFAECGEPVPGMRFDDVTGGHTRDGPYLDEPEGVDTDGDGTPDDKDTDDDNDGIPDIKDASPKDPSTAGDQTDTDKDGYPDGVDPDDDNDGIPDAQDISPKGNPATGQPQPGDGQESGGSPFTSPPPPTETPGNPARPPMPPPPEGGGMIPPDDLSAIIRNALNDEGNAHESSFSPNTSGLTDHDVDKGKSEQLEETAKAMTGKMDEAKTGMLAKIQTLLKSDHLPTSLGNVTGVDLGSIKGFSLNIQFTPFATGISLLRMVVLFGLGVTWLYMCVDLVRGALS